MSTPASVVNGLAFADDKKKYIVDVLDPVLEDLIAQVVTDLPDNPLEYMITKLQKMNGSGTVNMRMSTLQINTKLKTDLKKVTETLEEAAGSSYDAPVEEEEEEEQDDETDEPPPGWEQSGVQVGKARASVSAEAYGEWNTQKAFSPPVHQKTTDQNDRLRQTLLRSFMFDSLDEKDLEIILLAMKEVPLVAGAQVIMEGEDGDYLFVIERGNLDCLKNINGETKVVKTCTAGDVFGELALLYNCPRAANVVAKDHCVCWQLDRETFNHVVKNAAVNRRNRYDDFLKSVTLISSLGAYERSQIADALKSETFSKGSVIVKQDDPGDKFYIVEEGSLYATKSTVDSGEKRVMDYAPGDYFGELALLQNQPRAASVIVSSDMAKVLSMSRAAFSKMLGPLQHLLARQVSGYTQ